MTEIEQKAVEEMKQTVSKAIDDMYQEGGSDIVGYITTALDKAGYRKRSETVKEFAEKVIDVIFSHSGIAQDCSKVLASPEILQDEINDLAAEFGKEE